MLNKTVLKNARKSYEKLTLKETKNIQGAGSINSRALCRKCRYNTGNHTCGASNSKWWW